MYGVPGFGPIQTPAGIGVRSVEHGVASRKMTQFKAGRVQSRCQTVTMRNLEEIERFLDSIYRTNDGDPAPMLERLPILLMHPLMAIAALRYLMKLPLVRVSMPGVESSKTRWLFDPRRPWNFRGFISSFIEVPAPLDSYWHGTSKQNLRTRSHQARTAGFHVRAVDASGMNGVISQV